MPYQTLPKLFAGLALGLALTAPAGAHAPGRGDGPSWGHQGHATCPHNLTRRDIERRLTDAGFRILHMDRRGEAYHVRLERHDLVFVGTIAEAGTHWMSLESESGPYAPVLASSAWSWPDWGRIWRRTDPTNAEDDGANDDGDDTGGARDGDDGDAGDGDGDGDGDGNRSGDGDGDQGPRQGGDTGIPNPNGDTGVPNPNGDTGGPHPEGDGDRPHPEGDGGREGGGRED